MMCAAETREVAGVVWRSGFNSRQQTSCWWGALLTGFDELCIYACYAICLLRQKLVCCQQPVVVRFGRVVLQPTATTCYGQLQCWNSCEVASRLFSVLKLVDKSAAAVLG